MSETTYQHITPDKDKDGYKCILESSHTDDGTLIEGHEYRDVVNFYDKDTERWYSVLKCERCGYPSVSWTENPMHAQDMAQGFKYSQEIGGTIDG